MHDVIKQVVGSVIRGNFFHEKPSWGLVVDNARAERHGEHVVQLPVDGIGGALLATSFPIRCSGWCEGQSCVMGATEGLGYASWVVVVRDLSLPGACGPNLAHITSDN